ncbi:MAG: hypothetical protein NNA18_10630 [Nitrospira sp.]|nr:hypothetical protein [Nitrospira sp.]
MARPPRLLTHDERKAAEAAFEGRPCNPRWSESAKRVYEGLVQAMLLSSGLKDKGPAEGNPADEGESSNTNESPSVFPTTFLSTEAKSESHESPESPSTRGGEPYFPVFSTRPIISGQKTGGQDWLIDVSEAAQKLGLPFPVTVTRPLWERGIAPAHGLSEEEAAQRLRDVLMAFRLRLVGQPIVAPLLYFPAMLAFPPQGIPQPVLLSALIQADEQRHPIVTLLLPHEIVMTPLSLN